MVTKYPVNNGEVIDSDDMNQAFYQGFLTAENLNYDNVNVGTSATQIVSSNSNRLSIIIRNFGAQSIFISTSDSVEVDEGIELLNDDVVYLKTREAIYGVSSDSSDVRFLEVVDDE